MNKDELIKQYPYFAKIIKWLYKPKHYKDKYRAKSWEKFNPDKNIKVEKYDDGTIRLSVEINWSQYDNKIFDYFTVDYNPNSWEQSYSIYVYFAYARSWQGETVTIEDIIKEYCQDDALYRIQRCCYQFMN